MQAEDYELLDDDLDEFDDDDELDAFEQFMDDVIDDDDEDVGDIERKRRRRPRRRSRLRRSRSSFRRGRQPPTRYATVEQVSKGFARSDRNDKALSNRITSLQRSTSDYASKTNKRLKSQQMDVDNIKQMTLLTSLLSGDKKLKVKSVTDSEGDPASDITRGSTVTFSDASDKLDKFLPFLLLGGLGGKSSGGLGDNPLLLFLLIGGLGDGK